MNIPAACPVCGAYSIQQETQTSALLAVCDTLCLKALEVMGKWIVRADRSRFRKLAGRPYPVAHTIWQPTDDVVTKALRSAWDVVPPLLDAYGCCGVTPRQVTDMLDRYIHDLCITGTEHTRDELAYRFTTQLGLPVFDHAHA